MVSMIPRVWSKLLAISEHTLWGSGLCIAPLLSGYSVHLTVSHTSVAMYEQCHRCLQKYEQEVPRSGNGDSTSLYMAGDTGGKVDWACIS